MVNFSSLFQSCITLVSPLIDICTHNVYFLMGMIQTEEVVLHHRSLFVVMSIHGSLTSA